MLLVYLKLVVASDGVLRLTQLRDSDIKISAITKSYNFQGGPVGTTDFEFSMTILVFPNESYLIPNAS
jgi:hypothetical protein